MNRDITVYNVEQGSPEWFQARLGIPTASEFATVCAKPGPRGGVAKGRRTYMLKLLGERLTGRPQESYSNDYMERGKAMEDEARNAYAFHADAETTRVGFMRLGDAGCSPDALVGTDGLSELKTHTAHLQLAILLDNEVPTEHVHQLQGQLWISGRQWVDYFSYWPGIRPYLKRVYRDEAMIADIAQCVADFNGEIEALRLKVAA